MPAIDSSYMTLCMQSVVALAQSCPVLKTLQVFCSEQPFFHIPSPEIWGCSFSTRLPMLEAAKRKRPDYFIVGVTTFDITKHIGPTTMTHQRYRQTVRRTRTDGQTTYTTAISRYARISVNSVC